MTRILKYCVTARNRLTGKREVVTPPCSKEKAEEAKLNFQLTRYKRDKRAYSHAKVEIYTEQTELFK